MKTYIGRRMENGTMVTVDGAPGQRLPRPLPPRFDLRNHAPDGFEWGYSGSGPAQLALALCADVLTGQPDRALRVYQTFKSLEIATIQTNEWTLTELDVMKAIQFAELLPAKS